MQSSMNNDQGAAGGGAPKYRRRMRNYLLDVGLQLRYTMTIVIVAVILTGILGYLIYDANRDASKIIMLTGLADPTVAGELQSQFASTDRRVLWAIVGLAFVLVISISAVGILITHRVAGPIFKVAGYFARVRGNRLGAIPQSLRKGDELQEFYSSFREMYEALRTRVASDVQHLGTAIAVLEAVSPKSPQVQEALAELRELRREKEQSLEPG